MNYATDRLDRKSRSRIGLQGLFHDFQQALAETNHSRLAHVALHKGCNQAAAYHAGTAWMEDPDNSSLAGDYAQICELNGYPEIGLLALLCFRLRGRLKSVDDYSTIIVKGTRSNQKDSPTFEDWSTKTASCGCRLSNCGFAHCFVAMLPESIHAAQRVLRNYFVSASKCSKSPVLTAHEILMSRSKKDKFDTERECSSHVPLDLQFWNAKTNSNTRRLFPVVLQTLLIKLLYLTIPSLACELLVHVSPLVLEDNKVKANMVVHHKSHMAYMVLIDALVFGSKHALVKPGRRHSLKYFHVPVHDQCHGLDARRDFAFTKGRRQEDNASNSDLIAFDEGMEHENLCAGGYSESKIGEFTKKLDVVVQFASSHVILQSDPSRHVVPSPLTWLLPRTFPSANAESLYLVGDSHVLSLAWQLIQLPSGDFRRIVPVVVTGLKAWHVRPETRFFTRVNLANVLSTRIRSSRTILFSAGEIDCREGLGGPLLERYKADDTLIRAHVERTVQEYVDSLTKVVEDVSNSLQQILVLPVAPHAAKGTSRIVGQASRWETTRIWNETLQQLLPSKNVHYLDYSSELLDKTCDSYTLLRALDADSTHMNAAFAPLLEKSIAASRCAQDLI
ncbi:hypothetical protein MPSEU_000558000 [Mayamaea pseudoterrestris]|nr:hypothetical protein MPSEU_000558000 [Mayamaea pseudoterrestris]